MKWIRAAVGASVLAGLGLACSGPTASKPANAPPPSEEKPLGMPKTGGEGLKQRPARPGG